MNYLPRMLLWPAALACCSALAQPAAPAQTPSRGQLLYNTHCISCHTTEMHWRAARRAVDWSSLQFQVNRWQGNAGLSWSEADVTEVARYLNDTIYQYPRTVSQLAP